MDTLQAALDAVLAKNTFRNTFLAYILPIERMLNKYSGKIEPRIIGPNETDALKPAYLQTFGDFAYTVWTAIEGYPSLLSRCGSEYTKVKATPEALFNIGLIMEQITSVWYASDDTFTNPKTDEMEFLENRRAECEKYFPDFEGQADNLQLLIAQCIGMAIYDLSYWLEHGKLGGHLSNAYDFICGHLESVVSDYEDEQKLLSRETALLKEDLNAALAAKSLGDACLLKARYASKLYLSGCDA